ncbi:hypothetical protein CPB85DRAFT_1226248, partial [Mucidula mucida]
MLKVLTAVSFSVRTSQKNSCPVPSTPGDEDAQYSGSRFLGGDLPKVCSLLVSLHQYPTLFTALDPFDYEQKYSEAEPYKEMGDGGRIWKTYVEESIKVDANQVADWTNALDVLLVFAGLFSAVVSSFVSQTYQSLLVDHSEVTSYLTYESINLQRAKDANISLSTIPRSELAPNSTSDPSLTAVCVNGLWFTSLTLSLTTALIAVLTKQWIHQYMSFSQTGGPRERTQLRQARADNLEAWNVPVIIGLLPVMMHVALGVFLAGLIIFL